LTKIGLLNDYKQFIETERRNRRRKAILLLNTVLFRDKKSTTLNQQNAPTCFLDICIKVPKKTFVHFLVLCRELFIDNARNEK
jgi:hypothetical protein